MAILHQATLRPSKLELLQAYIPTLAELDLSPDTELALLGAYRFDDPAGDVGIETHIITASDGRTLQIPLTYRAAPLEGADDWFVATLEHSALGTRWVYNGFGDPVYRAELIRTIIEGDSQVKLEILTPDGTIERKNTVHVKGSGGASDATDVELHYVLEPGPQPASPHLAGTWPGVAEPVTMATIRF